MVIISKKTNGFVINVRWKLVITYLIIIFLILFLISIYINSTLEKYFFKKETVSLLTKANIVARVTSKYVKYTDEKMKDEVISDVLKELQIDKSIRVIITDAEAKVLFDTAETNNLKDKVFLKEDVVKALQEGKDVSQTYYEEGSGWSTYAVVPKLIDNQVTGAVYLSTSAQHIVEFLGDVRSSLYTIALIVIILAGILSTVFAGIITRPIEHLTSVIKKMPDGKMSSKVKVKGNDEIAELTIAFNKMMERLNEVEMKRQQFVSNASHELKTPLSSIKILVQSLMQMQDVDSSLLKEFLNDINGQIDRLTRIIDKLLMLTRMDFLKNELNREDVDVNKMIQQIYKSLLPLAQKKNINMDVKLENNVWILADRDKIWQIIFNIVDNSIKYTSDHGNIDISCYKENEKIIIKVEDTGIGIPEEDINKIFDRFYRVDKARARETGGTGLGLSIVLDAIKLHEGNIEVKSTMGKGSKFTIILPTGV